MRIKINRFGGIAPGVSPRLVSDQFSQTSENIDFISGALTPTEADGASEFTLQNGNRRSIFFYNDSDWLEWAEEVDAVPGPIPNDTNERLYWTGEDYPRMGTVASIVSGASGYPATSYRLGVPAPENAPTLVKTGTADDEQIANTVSYVYTFVTAFGEEGPPSAPSATVELTDTESVEVTMPALDHPSGNYNFGSGALKRIYRSNTGSNTTNFQFVGEVAFATTTFNDSTAAAGLGEIIPSTYWIGPPDDDSSTYPDGPMEGLISLSNGMFAGFTGNRVCVSEAYLPHAWPISYRISTEEDVVAIATSNNGIVALTDGRPYFIAGTTPSTLTAVQINLPQACINKHSVVDMGEYVLYASPDGLCAVEANTGEVITRGLITPKQWNADFAPTTYRAGRYEGTYVAFDGVSGGWVYDPRATEGAISTLTAGAVRGTYHDPKTGELYMIVGSDIIKYRGHASNYRTATWKSKEYISSMPVSMSWIQVLAESYPAQVKVYVDDNLIADYTFTLSGSTYTQTVVEPSGVSPVSLREPIARLPATVGIKWEVEVITANTVHEVTLAQTMEELREE